VAAGQYGTAESRRVADAAATAAIPSRTRRPAESSTRRTPAGGPAFINDEAEEQHYLDLIHDPKIEPGAKAAARQDLARLYERDGRFAEAAEQYERNIWAGVRTPATYAGLAAAYRELGRDDLAESTLEQVRRQSGASSYAAAPDRDAEPSSRAAAAPGAQATPVSAPGMSAAAPRHAEAAPLARTARAALPARPDRGPAPSRAERTASLRSRLEAAPRGAPVRRPADRPTESPSGDGNASAVVLPGLAGLLGNARTASASASQAAGDALGQLQRSVTPFLAAQGGRRTLIISTVALPIVLGLVIFGVVVFTSARGRAAETAAAPTPAPVATIAPTAAPTSAIPAVLADPSTTTRMLVNNVGTDGLSLRRSPGNGQRIKVWPDGTALTDLGESAEQGGKTWKRVRDPEGNEGWVAADFLVSANPPAGAAGSESGAGTGTRGAPSPPPFASGGLGLSRTEWEKANGKPTRTSIFLEYAGGRLVIGLLENNVWHLERVWKRDDAVALDAARDDARAYLPSDATLIQSVDRGDGRIIDVYSSAILTNRFGTTAWNGGRSGTFSIQYRFRTPADRMVTSAMFRLGDALF
jgi:tetratricopeptide (TPR) repeat protein